MQSGLHHQPHEVFTVSTNVILHSTFCTKVGGVDGTIHLSTYISIQRFSDKDHEIIQKTVRSSAYTQYFNVTVSV